MDQKILALAALALQNPKYDGPWQSLGFDKKPKKGGFFSSKPQWKEDLESRVALHIVYASGACSLQAEGLTSENDVRSLVDALRSLPSNGLDLKNAFEYISYYTMNSPNAWVSFMLKGLHVSEIPDSGLQLDLSSGVAKFCAQSKHAIEDMARRLGN